jgi:hypothetical protein
MNVWTQTDTGAWARDEKISLLNFLVGILAVLVALLGIFVAILIPNIRGSLGLNSEHYQSEENARQTKLLMEAKDNAIRELQAELEKTEAAKNAAEQRAKEVEERAAVWQTTIIENPTQCEIKYEVLNVDGSWEAITVQPNRRWLHWRKNNDIKVRYSYCLKNGGSRQKEYTLIASKVVGHEPTESERESGPVNYFAWNDSELLMYSR